MDPGMLNCSMARFTANAAPTATAPIVLCPSMWPGAPGTSGLRLNSPGACEPSGSASTSVAIRISGFCVPQRAHSAVGMPAPPSSTEKPAFWRTPWRNFALSNSCMPGSAK